jgi:hypothetical protein
MFSNIEKDETESMNFRDRDRDRNRLRKHASYSDGQLMINMPVVDITFCWAHGWYAKMYKKLGWMALIKSQGYRKYRMYLNTIDHLIESIKLKKTKTTNSDRVNDLDILLKNSNKLKEFANKLLNNTNSTNESLTEEGIPTKVTMKWLSKWHAKMYEKLGWMALRKSEGKKYKIKCYLRSINDLIASAKKKINDLTETDFINDARIILSNSQKLKQFAEILLV